MSTKDPGLALLERRVDELGLRREVEEELAQILIEHKIANLRKRRGLTQAALARRSGVTQPMIAQIESGTLSNLTLKTLARTARALGASLKIDLVTHPTIRRRSRGSNAAMEGMAAGELLRLAKKRGPMPPFKPIRIKGSPLSTTISEERDER